MIEFKNVTKTYGDIIALEDVSFDVDEGEFVFIAGASGAGKTTLLKLLLGKIQPTAGEVVFNDLRVDKLKKRQLPLLRQQIGVVFQDFKLLHERTIRENVEVALAVKEVERKLWRNRVDEVLDLVGVGDRSELFPSQLSGGELQRVSLARALVVNPKVVFADEPTGNLDWDTAEDIIDLFIKINKEGKTVLMASHHKKIIDELDNRVIKLKKGKLVEDTKPKKKEDSKEKPRESKKEEKKKDAS